MRSESKSKRLTIPTLVLLIALAGAAVAVWQVRSGARTPGGPETWSAEQRQHIETQHEAAAARLRHGQAGEARVMLEALLEQYPRDPEGHALLARAHLSLGHEAKAYEAAKRAVELDPADAESADFAGMLAERREELATARRLYARAVEVQPERAKYRLQLANVLLKLDELDAARHQARAALKLDPTLAVGHGILGYADRRAGAMEEAAGHFRKAIRHSDRPRREADWSIELSRTLRAQGEAGAAEAVNVLSELPSDWRMSERLLTAELAEAYRALGEPAKAADAWRAWLAAHPGDAEAAAMAGLAFLQAAESTNDPQLGRSYREAAKQYWRRADRLKPHHPDVRKLGRAVEGSGE